MKLFVFTAVVALFIAATANATSIVALRLDVRNASTTPVGGTIRLQSTSDPSVHRDVTIKAPRVELHETAGSEWNVEFVDDRWWSSAAKIVFPADDTVAERTLPVWRTGVVKGRVTAGDEDIEPPKSISLIVESPPMPASPPDIARGTTFDCPVGADGRWSCRIPATTLDLVVRQKAVTPHYRWGVAISATAPKDLGTFVLRRGASLTAWLDRESAKKLTSPARARLVRSVTPLGGQTSARLSIPVAEAAFNSRGAVQLAPVPPGTYVLEVSADGFATARVAPVHIFPRAESVFRKPIELRPPITMKIAVEPAADADGKPWRIDLRRNNDFVSGGDSLPAFNAAVDRDGVATIPQQEPGTFVLQVLNANGDRIADRSFSVHDENDADIRVAIESHAVSGTITLGGEPLAATLWFGSRYGAQRVKMTSNEEGKFAGSLPRRGEWTLDVDSNEPPFTTVTSVAVPGGEKALSIELPDTRVSGWVIGSDGRRLTRGSIRVLAGGRAFERAIAPDGSFTLRALPAGSVNLIATDRRTAEQSAAVDIAVAAGERREGLELRVEPSRPVVGTVVSRGQPVIGASVTGYGLDAAAQDHASTATDVTGRFVLYLPQRARRAHVTVGAPGRTLQSFELAISEAPLTIELEPVGGVLEIAVNGRFRVSRNGVAIPLPAITDWMSGHGDPLSDRSVMRIPDLAPGRYEVCSAAAVCVSGELAPSGTLRLSVPK